MRDMPIFEMAAWMPEERNAERKFATLQGVAKAAGMSRARRFRQPFAVIRA
ncbi:hypothetical protein [Burkholderia sp. 22PA0106]|uniref:hypothetical protein n=1 Tax=Burkholderia sp. 22PA0106 TaxID=3237371 RepID=UPI0039C4D34D